MTLQAFNEWLGIAAEQQAIISEVVEMLHNASLLCVRRPHPRALS